jgi:hypothetical protein
MDANQTNGVHTQYFEGEVLALADQAAQLFVPFIHLHPQLSAHAAVDECKPNGIHDQYFEGEVLALADLAALESHSGTDLPFSVVLIPMRSFLYGFPLQSSICSIQSPSLFYSNEGLSCHSFPGADTYIVAN